MAIFVLYGFLAPSRQEASAALFRQLNTPLSPASVPRIDTMFLRALSRLFSLSLLIAGVFFAVVSAFAIRDLSGQLALGAGVLCMLLGLAGHRWAGAKLAV